MKRNPEIWGVVRLNRKDLGWVSGYWLIALPIVVWYNGSHYDARIALQAAICTFVLDTAAVTGILISMPYLVSPRSRPIAVAVLVAVLSVLGLAYMISYGLIRYHAFEISLVAWLGGLLQHGRSYVLLVLITGARKIVEIIRAYIKLEKMRLQISLLLEKTRIDPHFIFNTINTIQNELEAGRVEKSTRLLAKFSGLLEYRLYDSEKDVVPLKEELDHIREYIDLQAERFGPETFRLEIPEEPAPGHLVIAPGILMQYLENAFEYGAGGSEPIRISWRLAGGGFIFLVRNPVVRSGKKRKGGRGVPIAEQLLANLYPGRHVLDVQNSSNQYTVHLQVNLL